MKANAIIVAGGSGKRFGKKSPKQFLNLNKKPVFLWSVETFLKIKVFTKIIVVVPENKIAELSKKYKNLKKVFFTAGGKERFDSVKAGLKLLDNSAGFVAIHDGARPLISKNDILSVLKAAQKTKAAIAAEKTRDTIKMVTNGYVQKTLNRNLLWNIQTPQIFKTSLIRKAYLKKVPVNTTDDSQLVEKFYKKIAVVEMKYPNFKITTPADLEIAKKVLKGQK